MYIYIILNEEKIFTISLSLSNRIEYLLGKEEKQASDTWNLWKENEKMLTNKKKPNECEEGEKKKMENKTLI